MAKTAGAPGAAAVAEEPAKKSGKKSWIVGGIVGLLALGGGAAVPMFAGLGAHAKPAPEPEVKQESKTVTVPFDSVVVNVADGRYTRYLRVRIALVVDAKEENSVKELMEKEKPFLQTWVLGYLQDRTMEQLHGSSGMNKVRREIRDEFNHRLFGDGPEKIKDVLLPEYNFQ